MLKNIIIITNQILYRLIHYQSVIILIIYLIESDGHI